MLRMRRGLIFGAALAALVFAGNARAEQIVVSNYGIAANGMPYAVAMEKGFFKEEGADVTGILPPTVAAPRSATCSAAISVMARSIWPAP